MKRGQAYGMVLANYPLAEIPESNRERIYAACREMSERNGDELFLWRIEDSPQLVAASVNINRGGPGKEHFMKLNEKKRIILAVAIIAITFLGEGYRAGSCAEGAAAPVTSSLKDGAASPKEDKSSSAVSLTYPLYDRAIEAFSGGGYAAAQGMFEQIVQLRNFPAEITEDAWRKLADCAYFLGEKNGAPSFNKAVEYYRTILSSYPDVRAGNDLVHYRLAKSYENLKSYRSAVEQLEALAAQYPSSLYVQDAFFSIGTMMEKDGKLERAVENYRLYLFRYPDGKYAKSACFSIGDCYYRLRQTVNADIWFRGAVKKWPDLQDLSREVLLHVGFHNYQMGRYAEAVSIFSLYVSLYPKDDSSRHVLYSLAYALAGMGQTGSAVKVFGGTMEQFPGTREARDSAISMVDLVVEKSGMKARVPTVFGEGLGYRDPLSVYDSFLAKYPQGELTEYLLYRKGYALFKGNRPIDAFLTFDRLLVLNPKGRYSEFGKRYLKMTAALVVGEYGKKDDHLAVADIYFRSYARHLLGYDDYATCYQMARSLVEVGLYAESLVLLKELMPREKDPNRRDGLIMFVAEINRLEGRDRDAEDLLMGLLSGSGLKNQAIVDRIKRDLARIYFLRGDWLKAARNYGDISNTGRSEMTALDFYRYAQALSRSKQYGQALANYRQTLKMVRDNPGRNPPRLLSESYLGIGECLYRENNFPAGLPMYQQALPGLNERKDLWWVNLRIGQGYTHLNRLELGEKAFAEAKATAKTGDPFVVKVIDSWKEDYLWHEQNRRYLE
ncbi:MAG: tetratricopeptide repeat protein [Syntrophales bacterium]